MKGWKQGIAAWKGEGSFYISIPFTWLLPEALKIAEHMNRKDIPVIAGGTAVQLMPKYLLGYASMPDACQYSPLEKHNPDATFTTRGCPRHCSFCAVPKIEGAFRELKTWPIRPVVCDNNFLESSRIHFDSVIDKLKGLRGIDFNQGLDARLFTSYHAGRLAELRLHKLRFAFDHIRYEKVVAEAVQLAVKSGIPRRKISIYVLIGHKDTPEDALHRLEYVRDVLDVIPYPMRYQPLDALFKSAYVNRETGWSERELRKMLFVFTNQVYLGKVNYREFEYRPRLEDREKRQTNLNME